MIICRKKLYNKQNMNIAKIAAIIYCITLSIFIAGCSKVDPREHVNRESLADTINPVVTIDTVFTIKLGSLLSQNMTDSILHFEWTGNPGDTLLGLSPMEIASIPENTESAGRFYHYNKELLAKLNAALDFPPITDIVKNLSEYELIDYISGISYYFRGCRDTSQSEISIAELLINRLHLKAYQMD